MGSKPEGHARSRNAPCLGCGGHIEGYPNLLRYICNPMVRNCGSGSPSAAAVSANAASKNQLVKRVVPTLALARVLYLVPTFNPLSCKAICHAKRSERRCRHLAMIAAEGLSGSNRSFVRPGFSRRIGEYAGAPSDRHAGSMERSPDLQVAELAEAKSLEDRSRLSDPLQRPQTTHRSFLENKTAAARTTQLRS